MYNQADRPNIDEQYSCASNTSDLTVAAHLRGAGDVLIAAGWCTSRVGAALLRLHSEWDSASRPKRQTEEMVSALADTLPLQGQKDRLRLARKMADDWFLHEQGIFLGRLKSLPSVRNEVELQAKKWGMGNAVSTANIVLLYWLDQTCHACEGRKFKRVAGAPSLSAKLCHNCCGTGVASVPCGQDGKRLANYLDLCVQNARVSIKKRLHDIKK